MDNWDRLHIEQIKDNTAKMADAFTRIADALERLAGRKTEPQTSADQHVQRVEYVENDERSRCWNCEHFESMHETPISSDGKYYTYVICTASECNYEPKDEPQTDCAWK